MLFSRGCVVSSIDFGKIAEDALYRDEDDQDGGLIIDWSRNSWSHRFDLIDFDKSGCKSILIFLSLEVKTSLHALLHTLICLGLFRSI